jgi:hypothetical protein
MKNKPFKYQDYLNKYPDCPDSNCHTINDFAYRWLHKGTNDDNFKPALLINPNRTFETDKINCIAYSLSMFDSEINAYNKYKKIVGRKTNLKEKLGTQIGEILLIEEDGLASEPETNNFGHFSFFEKIDVDLSHKIIRFVEIFDENGEFTR